MYDSVIDQPPARARCRHAGDATGISECVVLPEHPGQRYHLFVPRGCREDAPVLVSVHGISRNAREHIELFAPLAERAGVVLLAPHFDRRANAGYQRLQAGACGVAPELLLDAMLADAGRRLGRALPRLHMFGYSGGGQFVHRYLLTRPQRVERAVLGAPGWYTFPDERLPFPLGLGWGERAPPRPRPADFLRVPVTVIVGACDTQRDEALNRAAQIDREQGRTRLERGMRWVASMQAAALRHGLDTPYRFHAMPGIGHDFGAAMTTGGMDRLVFDGLFGAASAARADDAWLRDCVVN